MELYLIYIIKSAVCLTLFYLFFKALLSRETFSRFNRFVLLSGMVVCVILPVIQLKVSQTSVIQEPVAKIESFFITPKTSDIEIIPDAVSSFNLIDINHETNDTANTVSLSSLNPSIPLITLIKIIYGIGFFITLVSLLISISKMLRIIYQGTKIRNKKFTIVVVREKICPFSWGRYIVINEQDYRQNPNEILTHEAVHIVKCHSLDLLFAELLILFHWFNPVAWLLKTELQDVHEYEADKGVINQGIDATKYQLMLVKKAVGARSYAIANSFNHSKIKKRITMMLKEKSTHWARVKLLAFVPLALVLLQAFARPETFRIQESLITGEVTTIFEEFQLPEVQTLDLFEDKVQKISDDKKELETISEQMHLELEKELQTLQLDIQNDSQQKIQLMQDGMTLFADGIELFAEGMELLIFPELSEQIEIIDLQVEELIKQFENDTIREAISLSKDQQKRLDDRRKQFEIRAKQTEQKMKERQQQLEKRMKEQQKIIDVRLKERQQQMNVRQQQMDVRMKERQQQMDVRMKEQQQKIDQLMKERQKHMDQQMKERQKLLEERMKENQKRIDQIKKEQQNRIEIQ